MSNLTSSKTKVSSRSSTRSSSILKSTSVESNNILSHDSELKIYSNREDASKYSLQQLQIIMKHDMIRFNNLLDFVLCSNKIIFTLFSHKKKLIKIILFHW